TGRHARWRQRQTAGEEVPMFGMRRREFMTLLGGAAAWPVAAWAQQPAMPVIGLLGGGAPESFASALAGFNQGLQEIGIVEGRNAEIEARWARGDYGRLPGLAADLVARGPSVIVTQTLPAASSARTRSKWVSSRRLTGRRQRHRAEQFHE